MHKNDSLQIAVLKTGSPVPQVQKRENDFRDMFARGIQTDGAHDDISLTEIDMVDAHHNIADISDFDGVIMSGSPAMIGDNTPWMLRSIGVVKEIAESSIPFLGVCFGHQVLGRAFDADVGANPRGRRIGTVSVTRRKADPLMDRMPSEFFAQVSHLDVIRDPGPHLEVLGEAAHDGCHIVRMGDSTWGVQFHPEFSRWTTNEYLTARESIVDAELGAGTASAWRSALKDTEMTTRLLRYFADLCGERAATKAA